MYIGRRSNQIKCRPLTALPHVDLSKRQPTIARSRVLLCWHRSRSQGIGSNVPRHLALRPMLSLNFQSLPAARPHLQSNLFPCVGLTAQLHCAARHRFPASFAAGIFFPSPRDALARQRQPQTKEAGHSAWRSTPIVSHETFCPQTHQIQASGLYKPRPHLLQ